MAEDQFATLRELLARGASIDTWNDLISHFGQLAQASTDGTVDDVALAYANEHLVGWSPALRVISLEQMSTPQSVLGRRLWLSGESDSAQEIAAMLDAPSWEHIEEVVFDGGVSREVLEWLGEVALPGRIAALSIEGCHWSINAEGDDFGRLLGRALVRQKAHPLRSLRLYDCYLNRADLAALQHTEALRSLRTLDVTNNFLDDEGLVVLAAMPWLSGLQELNISINPFGLAGVQGLAQSPYLTVLKRLTMEGDSSFSYTLGARGLLSLVYPSALSELEELSVTIADDFEEEWDEPEDTDAMMRQAGRVPQKWLDALVRDAPAGPHRPLRWLQIDGMPLSQRVLKAILASPKVMGLRSLDLSGAALGNDGVAAIAACEALHQLEELYLNHCEIGDSGLLALALSPHLRCLRRLFLDANPIAEGRGEMASEAVIALARAAHFPALQEISLVGNVLQEEGLLALANNQLPQLHKIFVGGGAHHATIEAMMPSAPGPLHLVTPWHETLPSRPPV